MIARALTSHRGGEAWVMRRRTQAEMDALVAAAGFRKLEQRIDEWGIFTVSLAIREGTKPQGAKPASEKAAPERVEAEASGPDEPTPPTLLPGKNRDP
jgi:hypothetical protein